MKREELKIIDLLCDMGTDANGNRNLQPWKAYDIDEVNLAIDALEAENERLKKEAAEYHQLQWQHDALIDENEKEMKILRIITSGYQIGELEYTGKYLPTLHTTDIPITDEQAKNIESNESWQVTILGAELREAK